MKNEYELHRRMDAVNDVAQEAGALALRHFRDIGNLDIERKGLQDLVSNADREVEILIRERITGLFGRDGIVGEEFDDKTTESGFTWVIDPIDGTANFLTGVPMWCVAIALVHEDETKLGLIFDPVHDEMFTAVIGGGAKLNNTPISTAATSGLDDGSIGFGLSTRPTVAPTLALLGELASHGGVFVRYATGCIGLAYVASGRLIGFVEERMNAWDCLAGQLLVAEAGGRVEKQSAEAMIRSGGRVVASAPVVFDDLVAMADRHFASKD